MTDADKLAVVKRLSDAIDGILRGFPILAQSEVQAAAQILAPHVEARMSAIQRARPATMRKRQRDMTLSDLLALAAAATPGPWRSVVQGGSSTVLCQAEPARNDTRIPAYAYDPKQGYCLAYPFLYEDRHGKTEVRFDFVSFSHADAKHIAAFDPPTAAALIKVAMAAERYTHDEPGSFTYPTDYIERIDESLIALKALLCPSP